MAKKDEVATIEETTTEVGSVGSYDYGDMAHEGFEDTKVTDLSIPFLNVLQANSPEVEDQKIEGCKAGDILNTVTGEIMKQPIIVQPLYKEEVWVEWVPRNKGGGLAGRHDPHGQVVADILKANGNSRIPPKGDDGKRVPFKAPGGTGNEIIETYYVYVMILGADGKEAESYGVMSFSSTKIKVQKDWMTSMYTQKGRPPMFANRAAVSTVKQKAEGGSFFNFHIGPFADTWRESLIPPGTDEGMKLLKEAQDFKKMIEEGLARPDFDNAKTDDDVPSGKRSSGGNAAGGDDGEIPF